MFGHDGSLNQFQKHVILFGNLFNDIRVKRPANGTVGAQTLTVPIEYGPRPATIARIVADPNFAKQATVLPRMSFEFTSLTRDPQRQLNRLNKRFNRSEASDSVLVTQFEPVSYVLGVQLSIYTKYAFDMFSIIEDIMPWFVPEWNVSVRMVPETDKVDNIRITLDSLAPADDYEGEIGKRRMLVWTINFSLYTHFYMPTSQSGLIKQVMVNFYASPTEGWNESQKASRYTVQPGLTADGKSTKDINLTIPYSDIGPNDDFGFVEQWEDFTGLSQEPENE